MLLCNAALFCFTNIWSLAHQRNWASDQIYVGCLCLQVGYLYLTDAPRLHELMNYIGLGDTFDG